MDMAEEPGYNSEDEEELLNEATSGSASASAGSKSLLGGLLSSLQTNVMGKEKLSAGDVTAAVSVMQKRLQERNVSSEVAAQVCTLFAWVFSGRRGLLTDLFVCK